MSAAAQGGIESREALADHGVALLKGVQSKVRQAQDRVQVQDGEGGTHLRAAAALLTGDHQDHHALQASRDRLRG